MLFSIIIPHHNIQNLLQRCLDSIPDTDDYQVIVVDDNSDPEIVNFYELQNLKRKNVEVILTKEGKGAGYARNVGLEKAVGDWLIFSDSDDFFDTDIDTILKRHINSSADMILFKARSVDSDSLEPSNRNENINKQINQVLAGNISIKEASLCVNVPWGRMIRRNLVSLHNIKFDEVMYSNDTMFSTKCTCLADKIEVSDDILYVITYRKGSLWDQRMTNPVNYLTRLKVQINKNNYVKKFGFSQGFILGFIIKAYNININTFFKALKIGISEGVLFQGFGNYLKIKIKKLFKLIVKTQ